MKGVVFLIYLYVALYPEAKPVILRFGLKKRPQEFGFDVYENLDEGIRLVITGVGMVAAAVAVGSSLAFFRAGEEDMLVNWGSCAGEMRCEFGQVYCCHALANRGTGRVFYPDMLVRTNLPEAGVISELSVFRAKDEKELLHGEKVILHDMEAAAVYEAGAYFLSPHQMHFLKVVSDRGMDLPEGDFSGRKFGQGSEKGFEKSSERMSKQSYGKDVEKHSIRAFDKESGKDCEKASVETEKEFREFFQKLMDKSADQLVDYLQNLKVAAGKMHRISRVDSGEEKLFQDFCCSQTMTASLRQLLRYAELAEIDYKKELEKMYEDGRLPCADRREGKRRLEEFRAGLL